MELTITVEGMHCSGCERTVEDALREVDGVTDAAADREAEQAAVSGTADVDALVEAVEQAGYTARA
jgi:copper chaperone CopZ